MTQEPALGETWDRVGGVALRLAQSGGAPGDQFLADLLDLREACDAQAARLAALERLLERLRDRVHLSSDPYTRDYAELIAAGITMLKGARGG